MFKEYRFWMWVVPIGETDASKQVRQQFTIESEVEPGLMGFIIEARRTARMYGFTPVSDPEDAKVTHTF